ncbi:hypothetical protein IQ249_03050 [Lusitaniella coriacea LEGE 07157]|uniref:Uncharacterized protein n=1 Tax=Lusitaniella coriacea LEGE 07157 TaxID=945747 RepID=A0A8J7AWQ4_9CYAN|nr:hypothetical protein [Lusitaniella coriacea]MBE9114867.1 hypothetical protein [Lusitaniella coriacea LEGE 07157]
MLRDHEKTKRLRDRLKNRRDCYSKPLDSLIQTSEAGIELAHVIRCIENNLNDQKNLHKCFLLINKFANKAIQTNRTLEWLRKIIQLLDKYSEFQEEIPAKLYIAKYKCDQSLNVRVVEAESDLQQAVNLSKNKQEKLNSILYLAAYHENNSKYKKMKKCLDKCKHLSLETSNTDIELAKIWLGLGKYHFYRFDFLKAKKYLKKAKAKFEDIYDLQESGMCLRLLSTGTHYLGRVHLAEYDFVKAAQFYIEAQKLIEMNCKRHNLVLDVGATAFYHLRMGQILETCRLIKNAKYHYDRSFKIFSDCGSQSGKVQVSLALANLIGRGSETSLTSQEVFYKKEKQIREAARLAQETGYNRGYLESLIRLLQLYTRKIKLILSIKTLSKIIYSHEFRSLLGLKSLSVGYKFAIGLYGLGAYYKIKFRHVRRYKSGLILNCCPCSECVEKDQNFHTNPF